MLHCGIVLLGCSAFQFILIMRILHYSPNYTFHSLNKNITLWRSAALVHAHQCRSKYSDAWYFIFHRTIMRAPWQYDWLARVTNRSVRLTLLFGFWSLPLFPLSTFNCQIFGAAYKYTHCTSTCNFNFINEPPVLYNMNDDANASSSANSSKNTNGTYWYLLMVVANPADRYRKCWRIHSDGRNGRACEEHWQAPGDAWWPCLEQ